MKAIHTQSTLLADCFTMTCAFEVAYVRCICMVKMLSNGKRLSVSSWPCSSPHLGALKLATVTVYHHGSGQMVQIIHL